MRICPHQLKIICRLAEGYSLRPIKGKLYKDETNLLYPFCRYVFGKY